MNAPIVRRINPAVAKALTTQFAGFDHLFELVDKAINNVDHIAKAGFPFRNIIVRDQDTWELQYAVAGFSREDLSVSVEKESTLVIQGRAPQQPEGVEYIHRGISFKDFRHDITIPEGALVSSSYVNGILSVIVKKPIVQAVEPKLIAIQ